MATKQDIALLEARMEAMKHEILGNAAAILAVAGIAFGAGRLH